MIINKCKGITKKGKECDNKAKYEGYCGKHKNKHGIKKIVCKGVTKKGKNCDNRAKYEGYCGKHKNQNEVDEKKQNIEETIDEKCSICLDEIETEYTKLLCGHYYHTNCLFQNVSKFTKNSGNCPICRTNFINIDDLLTEAKDMRNEINKYKYRLDAIKKYILVLIDDDYGHNLDSTKKVLKSKIMERYLKDD